MKLEMVLPICGRIGDDKHHHHPATMIAVKLKWNANVEVHWDSRRAG